LLCTSYGEYKAAKTCEDTVGHRQDFFIPLREELCQQRIQFYKILYITACANLHFLLCIWSIDGNSVAL
jgi:hypothetical protein